MNLGITTKINIEHCFLPIQEEAELERRAFFEHEHNIDLLNDTLDSFSVDPNEGVLIASVGSSTTQFFVLNSTIMGSMYVGSSALLEDSSLVQSFLENLFNVMRNDGHSHPVVVLINSIGHLVNSVVDLTLECNSSLETFLERSALQNAVSVGIQQDIKMEQSKIDAASKILNLMMTQSQEANIPVIVLPHKGVHIDNRWLVPKSMEIGEEESCPNNLYLIDFGGGGVDIYFFSPHLPIEINSSTAPSEMGEISQSKRLVRIGKDRSLRVKQTQFVNDLMAGKFASSKLFTKVIAFIRKTVTIHALSYDVEGPQFVCKIFQTGKARQQHFLGHFNATCDVTLYGTAGSGTGVDAESAPMSNV